MVRGINSFRDWFRGYDQHYIIIGGTACDLLMGEAGEVFRATRDIDMVLIVEVLNADFCSRIWEYVKAAGYDQRLKSTGVPEYYRFFNPKSSEYPAMIELFSRRIDGITLPPDAALTPLPIDDDISSLSATGILHSPATCGSITKTEYDKGDDEEEYILSNAQRGSGKNTSGGKQALCSAV